MKIPLGCKLQEGGVNMKRMRTTTNFQTRLTEETRRNTEVLNTGTMLNLEFV